MLASLVSFLRVICQSDRDTEHAIFLITTMSSGKYTYMDSSNLDPSSQSKALRISSSHIATFFKYGVVGALWLGGIYVVLLQTGVVEMLSHFDNSFRYQRGITPLTSSLTVAMIISGYAFDRIIT